MKSEHNPNMGASVIIKALLAAKCASATSAPPTHSNSLKNAVSAIPSLLPIDQCLPSTLLQPLPLSSETYAMMMAMNVRGGAARPNFFKRPREKDGEDTHLLQEMNDSYIENDHDIDEGRMEMMGEEGYEYEYMEYEVEDDGGDGKSDFFEYDKSNQESDELLVVEADGDPRDNDIFDDWSGGTPSTVPSAITAEDVDQARSDEKDRFAENAVEKNEKENIEVRNSNSGEAFFVNSLEDQNEQADRMSFWGKAMMMFNTNLDNDSEYEEEMVEGNSIINVQKKQSNQQDGGFEEESEDVGNEAVAATEVQEEATMEEILGGNHILNERPLSEPYDYESEGSEDLDAVQTESAKNRDDTSEQKQNNLAENTKPKTLRWRKNRGSLGRTQKKKRLGVMPTPVRKTSSSFISPWVYKISSILQEPRSMASHSSSRGPTVYSDGLSSVSNAVSNVIQPVGNIVQSIFLGVASLISNWVAMLYSFLLAIFNSFCDVLLGDGYYSHGLLGNILPSSTMAVAVYSAVLLGMLAVVVARQNAQETVFDASKNSKAADLFPKWLIRNKERRPSSEIDVDGEFEEDIVVNEPPTVEEELEFLESFSSKNPSLKKRISRTLIPAAKNSLEKSKKKNRSWPKIPRGQWQNRKSNRSIKKPFWKRRSGSSSALTVVEPRQPPLNQQIKSLQNQLNSSEQERASLQSSVERLQHQLERSRQETRSLMNQNRWLEKQTSKADQIMSRAVEVERRKANEEVVKVRDSVKDILDREKRMMRGGFPFSRNAIEETVGEIANVGGSRWNQNRVDSSGVLQGGQQSNRAEVLSDRDANVDAEEYYDQDWAGFGRKN
mmetsp:Transcript_32474/g.67155  ORF Transcript_32474/g.67155 Transcript_32474/m.67155 type:complete len:836 (+) Transcript_32474:447-2954(+)